MSVGLLLSEDAIEAKMFYTKIVQSTRTQTRLRTGGKGESVKASKSVSKQNVNPTSEDMKPHIIISKQTWCLTSTETTRLIRDGE